MTYVEVLKSKGIEATVETLTVTTASIFQHVKKNKAGDVIVDDNGEAIKWFTCRINDLELTQSELRHAIDAGNCPKLNNLLDGYELSEYSRDNRTDSGSLLLESLKFATIKVATYTVEQGDTVVLLDREYEREAENEAEYHVVFEINFTDEVCKLTEGLAKERLTSIFDKFKNKF